jgi:hypothetical protein
VVTVFDNDDYIDKDVSVLKSRLQIASEFLETMLKNINFKTGVITQYLANEGRDGDLNLAK